MHFSKDFPDFPIPKKVEQFIGSLPTDVTLSYTKNNDSESVLIWGGNDELTFSITIAPNTLHISSNIISTDMEPTTVNIYGEVLPLENATLLYRNNIKISDVERIASEVSVSQDIFQMRDRKICAIKKILTDYGIGLLAAKTVYDLAEKVWKIRRQQFEADLFGDVYRWDCDGYFVTLTPENGLRVYSPTTWTKLPLYFEIISDIEAENMMEKKELPEDFTNA